YARNIADMDLGITCGMSSTVACWHGSTPTRRSAWTACLTCNTTTPAADSVLFAVTFASKEWAWIFHNQSTSPRRALFHSTASSHMTGDTSPRRVPDSCETGNTGGEDIASP